MKLDIKKEDSQWYTAVEMASIGKPKLIKGHKKCLWFSDTATMADILKAYTFSAKSRIEDDGSITLLLNELYIIRNGFDEKDVRLSMGQAILKYAKEYYNDYALYSNSPRRRRHIPYVFKALIMDNEEAIGNSIKIIST